MKTIAENFPSVGKGNRRASPGSTESPRQDEAKEEHTKTHSDQTDKNIKLLKAIGEKDK